MLLCYLQASVEVQGGITQKAIGPACVQVVSYSILKVFKAQDGNSVRS